MKLAGLGTACLVLLLAACHGAPDKPPATATVPTAAKPVDAPSQLAVEVTPGASVLLAGASSEMPVRIRVRGLPLASAKRPVINLALVVDTSGSMDGVPIERAREACAALVKALAPGDALSIVTYGSKPLVVLPATRISAESRALAIQAISKMKAEGTTDMAGGLNAGLDQLNTFRTSDGINRVTLLGDGEPNDPVAAAASADNARNRRVPITSLGLGNDFDETLMASIAQRTGGTFHFIDDPARVTGVFEQELSKMERLVARRVWVEITPGPGVTLSDAVGLAPTRDGRGMRFDLGEISEGQVKEAMLQVSLTGHREGEKVELLDAVVHYDHAIAGVPLTESRFAGLGVSAKADAVTEGTSIEVQHQATRLRVADNIVRAIALARAGDVRGGSALLDATIKLAQRGAEQFDDAELTTRVKEVKTLKKSLPSLAPAPEPAEVDVAGPHPTKPPGTMPAPPKMAPVAALEMRRMHGNAMRDLQNE